MAVLVPLLASVAASGALVVRRAPETVDCPDAAALSAMVLRLTPKAPEAADVAPSEGDRFEVDFSRRGGRYRVAVRASGAHAGVRTIEDPSATCGPLAEATALTIAVIVDPEGVKLAEPPPAPPPPPPPPPPVTAPSPTEPPSPPPSTSSRPDERWSASGTGGAGAALGIVREIAPVLLVAFEVRPVARFSIDVGAIVVPPQSLSLERGSIAVWLIAGAAEACLWPYAEERLRLGACAGLAAGSVRGDAKGYPVASGASRPWVAATAGAAAHGVLAGPLGWSLEAEAVVPTHRESFGIEGAGVAYEEARVGGIVAAGLSVKIR